MRYVLAVVLVALVASLVFVPLASAQEKWVRGNVVSIAADTVTVKVMGKDMAFKVDKSTQLTARGAGTAQRQAEAKGAAGVKLTDFVKPGGGVEVHYKDVAGVLMAVEIFSGIVVNEGSAAPEPTTGGSARGLITAVSASSITVKGTDKDWTFTVDSKTTVVGHGLGTITQKFKEEGKKPGITDLLGVNDRVIVYYKEGTGTLASEIRLTDKALK